jgi:hypothetical protein
VGQSVIPFWLSLFLRYTTEAPPIPLEFFFFFMIYGLGRIDCDEASWHCSYSNDGLVKSAVGWRELGRKSFNPRGLVEFLPEGHHVRLQK